MAITVYGIKNCDTMKKALKWLDEQGLEYHFHDYKKDGVPEALLELDFRINGECELAYFGVTSALLGSGAGRFLMNTAIRLAWDKSIQRFHVHTCTLDHPEALGFYRRSGFTAYRQQIEIEDDPRLTGQLPMDAGHRVPIIR